MIVEVEKPVVIEREVVKEVIVEKPVIREVVREVEVIKEVEVTARGGTLTIAPLFFRRG